MITTAVAILFLLVLSAFFSGSETALTATSRPLMHELERRGNVRAGTVNRLIDNRQRLIGTILLGNNLVNILASALATNLMIQLFGDSGVAYATLGMTLLVLIFAEVLPKTYALTHTQSMALAVAPVMRAVVAVLGPFSIVIEALVQLTMKVFGTDTRRDHTAATTLAELRGAIEMHTRASEEEESEKDARQERAMLRSVLDLGDVEVSAIMVHRHSVSSIDADLPNEEIVNQVLASPYTRIPLWRERADNIVGVLHAKALLRAVKAHQDDLSRLDLMAVAADPWFIPDTTRLLDQLQAFRARREHFALVVDEYGTLQGVVTLEDILEEIVGDISDEHDIAVPGVVAQADGSYQIAGEVTLRDLNRQFDWGLPDEDAATVAGLVLNEARTIPQPGQVFLFHGFRFEVLKRQRNRITSLKVTPPAADGTPSTRN
ncbi:HlyC/CorC family transporter [Roseospirillum parvum]|uniref:Mg2+ and Co2+ transporter CorB, contains DUF21, CBS pair, and CorC-HlyC domains n=1 Tax=Roseospirillum parvum TaxID=83401 RepID=A0A1G8D6Q8_9PROT|nr:HlyC/CorC family transporter [Roseospirillum parvum]SDH53223.1 Mg2+ and Co2+ transporter CorB, contains DUF21, CBS pair, and CorC-HlyC domains [Roseospirillum parvum]